MSEKKSFMCLYVFLFYRSCFPWEQGIDSWSRPLCMIVFLSQALVWLSCSSNWVCSLIFKLLLWKPTKKKKRFILSLYDLTWIKKIKSKPINTWYVKYIITWVIFFFKTENTPNTLTQALFALESIRLFKSRHIFFML